MSSITRDIAKLKKDASNSITWKKSTILLLRAEGLYYCTGAVKPTEKETEQFDADPTIKWKCSSLLMRTISEELAADMPEDCSEPHHIWGYLMKIDTALKGSECTVIETLPI